MTNDIYADILAPPKASKTKTKKKAIELEVCPDNVPALSDSAEYKAFLKWQASGAKVQAVAPVQAVETFTKPKAKKAKTYEPLEIDKDQSPKQNYALRCTYHAVAKQGLIESDGKFPSKEKFAKLTYNQSTELLTKLNAMK